MLTTQQFSTLDDLYAFYNVELFGAALPECIVNLSRRPNSRGFFVPNLWIAVYANKSEEEEYLHEISLNPDYLLRPYMDWHSTFVHEMVHLWQHEFGKPARAYFHNREWVNKMEEIGLIPSDTGKPGGKKIGQSIAHYIAPEGLFAQVFNSLDDDALHSLRLRYLPVVSLESLKKNKYIITSLGDGADDDEAGVGLTNPGEDENKAPKSKSGIRLKYTCPCGNNVWGKSGLLIHCLECDENYAIL
jgi:hypothetical protein